MKKWNPDEIVQIQLPDPKDDDPHPSLLLNGWAVRPGASYTALFPDGWKEISIEMRWEPTGAYCWYIASPKELGHICPVGLFVKR